MNERFEETLISQVYELSDGCILTIRLQSRSALVRKVYDDLVPLMQAAENFVDSFNEEDS